MISSSFVHTLASAVCRPQTEAMANAVDIDSIRPLPATGEAKPAKALTADERRQRVDEIAERIMVDNRETLEALAR